MLGFEVRFKDKVIHAAINGEGILPVIVGYCNSCVDPGGNGTHLSIGGLVSFEHLRWFSGNLDDGEQTVIRVVDMEHVSGYHSYPQDRQELIQTYHSLKKELQEEGLI
jgi:hypothetical protein